ncbi:MAG TPA: SRPBCC family protein [Novosphingobium sp.]|mgnify:CR=1 FL=1|nr:SRPBCC family protein [Novosphingobium sp.]HMP56095.1 SRPBCC family protein [Novosphingobium sp.]
MIETEQTVTVGCDIDATWAYARDFQRWASIMPGYQSCEMEDADNSLWVLKVGVGGMVRTVRVKVRVVEWAGPERVDFTYSLVGDPVEGEGSYLATQAGRGQTAMTLKVRIIGSGPLAPMWEAMCGPVLPRFARTFAEQLKDRIEEFNGAATANLAQPSGPGLPAGLLARFLAWLGRLLGRA